MIVQRSAMQKKLAGDASQVHYGHRGAISIAWLMGSIREPFVGSDKADDANETYKILCANASVDPVARWGRV